MAVLAKVKPIRMRFSQRRTYSRIRDWGYAGRSRVLFTKREASPKRTFVIRMGIVLLLISLVLALFWFDREGLKDGADGEVSFADVFYFTMVTVTTVGYGDIVPVSERVRVLDALFVTPIRIFIWLIFLGTAYEFVVQKIIEDYRMAKLQRRLQDHIIVCGYGHSGRVAAREMTAMGHPADKVVVVDVSEATLRDAADNGFIGLRGDASRETIIRKTGVEKAKAVIVSPGRDDTNVLIVLTVRNLNSNVRIISSAKEEENIKLIKQSGADVIVSPAKLGGYLLADAVIRPHTVSYMVDLMTAGGKINLTERFAKPEEVGKHMHEIKPELVVRILRKGKQIGFWEKHENKIEEGDLLVIIAATGTKDATASAEEQAVVE